MTYGKPIGAVRGEKGCRAAALSSKTRIKKKKHRFCRHDGIKDYTRFSLEPKSATELG